MIMFRVNRYKIYVSLITIILLASQAQATRIKQEPLKQIPQELQVNAKQEMKELAELFMAPTLNLHFIIKKIDKRIEEGNFQLFSSDNVRKIALQKLAMEFSEIENRRRQIFKQSIAKMHKDCKAVLLSQKVLDRCRVAVVQASKIIGQQQQAVKQLTVKVDSERQLVQEVMQQPAVELDSERQQEDAQRTTKQLASEVNILLDSMYKLYENYSSYKNPLCDNGNGYEQIDVNNVDTSDKDRLNKILDKLTSIFTEAKQQNYIFSSSDLLDFTKGLAKIRYFRHHYDLQQFAALYTAIVQHTKLDKGKNYDKYAQLISYLVDQMKAFVDVLNSKYSSANLNTEKMEVSIAVFRILDELVKSNEEESDVALVSVLKHIIATVIPKGTQQSDLKELVNAFASLNIITEIICKMQKEQVKLLLPAIFRAYAHLHARTHVKKYNFYQPLDHSGVLNLASDNILKLVALKISLKASSFLAVKEAMRCVIVMINGAFYFESNELSKKRCLILQLLSTIDEAIHATILQSLRVYELAILPDYFTCNNYCQWTRNILEVLYIIGDCSVDCTILKDTICMLRRLRMVDGLNRADTNMINEKITTISERYISLASANKPKLKNELSIALNNFAEYLCSEKSILTFDFYRDLSYCTFMHVSQCLDTQDINPFYFIDTKQSSEQFLQSKPYTKDFYVVNEAQFNQFMRDIPYFADIVHNACFQFNKQQQANFAAKRIPECYYESQFQQFGAM